jgi:hypothetical protein
MLEPENPFSRELKVDGLPGVWRTEDRLHTDDAIITLLSDLARRDRRIGAVIDDLRSARPGNGSVWITGSATSDGGPAVLKLGARDAERAWMTAVDAASEGVVPRVLGSGDLRGVGWLVLEWCPYTLDRTSDAHVESVVDAVARFQSTAATIRAPLPAMDADWLRGHLEAAQDQECPGGLAAALGELGASWSLAVAECGVGPAHGDVHLANAVARRSDGPALLIDPMPIRTIWAWDAAYLDATLAPYRSRGADVNKTCVRSLAGRRSRAGLPVPDDLARVENLALGWAAAVWWRIAPWRHENEVWRAWVEQRVEELTE